MNKEKLFNEIIEGILHNRNFTLDLDINLVAENEEIFLELEGNKVHLTYMPYNFEGVKLNKITRKHLANDFIKYTTFKELKGLATIKRNKAINQQENEELNKDKLIKLVDTLELNKLFGTKYNKSYRGINEYIEEIKVTKNINGYAIEFNISLNSYSSCEVQITNNSDYSNFKARLIKHDTQEVEGLEAIKEALEELYKQQETYYNKIRKELQEIENINNLKAKLKKLYKDYLIEGQSIIIKYNSTMQVFNSSFQKHSIGKGKSGKYYKTSLDDFIKTIMSKKDLNKVYYSINTPENVKLNSTVKDYNFIKLIK